MDKINDLKMPDAVGKIMNALEESGHEAFIVGGCVRDALRGAEPADWDMCTDATPWEMFDIFGKPEKTGGKNGEYYSGWRIFDTGAKHGTVSILINDKLFEVTTYRIDGKYADNRHPDSVRFSRSIEDDLARRDFTVNAMAYNEKRGLIDIFGGREDLRAGIIRCVGNPAERYLEDALRIMRAMRFSAQLSFTIEKNTYDAMNKYAYLLHNISEERIREEFVKTLTGIGSLQSLDRCRKVVGEIIPEAVLMFGLDQKNDYHCYDVWQHTLHVVHYVMNTAPLKLAAFFHDIGKPPCMTLTEDGWGHFYGHEHMSAEMAESVMKRLKFDNKTTALVKELIWNHGIVFQQTAKHARHMLAKFGEEKLNMLIELELADVSSQAPSCAEERVANIEKFRGIVSDILEQQKCFSMRDMAIDGIDIMELGVPQGPEIGRILKALFARVMDEEIPNEKDILRREAEKML
ncbi:MAG: HD domain-containing protein [Eubacteriaceae bacterium]|jgi:tRNA nucleotidyltransferase (CCA-adding enzyme)|nr:HD domain-containing protein [Eubacteriaceae bacterium]